MIMIIRPCNHQNSRNLYSPIIEHFMVGSSVMRYQRIIERIIRAGRSNDRLRRRTQQNTLSIGRTPYITQYIFCNVIDIMRICHCSTMQTIIGTFLRQCKPDHIEINIEQSFPRYIFIGIRPRNDTAELIPPDKTERTAGAFYLSFFN